MNLLDKYLKFLEFGMPTQGIMASTNKGYKQLGVHPSSAIKKIKDDEDVKEYTTFNPSGDGYGRMLQRWNIAGSGVMGPNEPVQSSPNSQKQVSKKIYVKIKGLEKKRKEKKND